MSSTPPASYRWCVSSSTMHGYSVTRRRPSPSRRRSLRKPPPAGDGQGAAPAKVGQRPGRLDKRLGGPGGPKPGTAVPQHFAAINALVIGAPPPIDRLLALMGQAQQQLQSASGLGGQPG